MPPGKVPTLYDVARLAGVSHQTVSRLVKGNTNIRPALVARIEAAIAELGYRPNLSARSLATSRSYRIGALGYEIAETGPSRILQGAVARAREAGYVVDLVILDPDDEKAIEAALSLLNQADLAGVLALAPTPKVMAALDKMPFSVPLHVESDAQDRPSHTTRNQGGIDALVDHLLGLGHRRFFHIPGPEDWYSAQARRERLSELAAQRGFEVTEAVPGDWSSRAGYKAASAMPLDRGITAVVAANDQTALGAIAGLETRGVRVPEDVSIVGFDDIPEAQFFRPALTSIWLDFDRQGRLAVDELFRRMPDAEAPEASPDVAPVLRVRASTAPAQAR